CRTTSASSIRASTGRSWLPCRARAPFVLPFDALPYDPETMAPTGCMAGDWNEDGREDLLVYFWGRTPVVFLRREAARAPSPGAYRAVELAARPALWNTVAATQADLDGDGHLDLIFGNYF